MELDELRQDNNEPSEEHVILKTITGWHRAAMELANLRASLLMNYGPDGKTQPGLIPDDADLLTYILCWRVLRGLRGLSGQKCVEETLDLTSKPEE